MTARVPLILNAARARFNLQRRKDVSNMCVPESSRQEFQNLKFEISNLRSVLPDLQLATSSMAATIQWREFEISNFKSEI
jgi:hypothetical protein